MKNSSTKVLILIPLIFVLCLTSCTPNDNVSAACYQGDPVDELPWLKTLVEKFRQPKSGPFILSLNEYKGEAFFVLGNPTLSCPMCYIFNCEGKTIGQLGISYNEFNKERRKIRILLQEEHF